MPLPRRLRKAIKSVPLALKKLGDDVESVTYFGDAEWDRRACKTLGWNFVAVGPDLVGIESYVDVEL